MQSKPQRKRILGESWLSAYRRYIIKQESPDIFHFWVAVTLISAVLKRNVYVDRDAYKVYPNQYVFFVAGSGLCRKSSAAEIGINLVQKIDELTIIYGRATVEGLIDVMNKASADPLGVVKPDGSVLIYADELSYLFGKASYITDLITFFTSAYTSKARLDFLTRGKGLAKVRNPCPTIMACTTPEQMGDVFPSLVLVSGFFARVILVWGDTTSRISKPSIRREMDDALVHDLGCIAQLCGEMKMTTEADEYFDDWYNNLKPPEQPELVSFYQRKHDHVLKTAMIISVAESDEMVMTLKHLDAGIAAIDYVESKIPDAISAIGATIQSTLSDQIVYMISLRDPVPVSHSIILRRIYRKLTHGAQEFQQIIDSLKQADRIREEATERGIFYRIK